MSEKNSAPDRGPRLHVDMLLQGRASTLAADVLRGLGRRDKSLPPKHFYDERGSELFDRICETSEYYQTRTELWLLERVAPFLMGRLRPTDIVELGSGSARKTRVLFDSVERALPSCRYVPFDVSESALRRSAEVLLARYPWLEVHGVVGDYDEHLACLPVKGRSLFVFLGGTIGNFEAAQAVAFLRRIRACMSADDQLLLGTDLVKDPGRLDRAYNDAGGVTEAFNKNVLLVINRELGGDFEPNAFRHVAFYDPEKSQVEMHLESRTAQEVVIEKLGLSVSLGAGERILTEVSRKFTLASVSDMLGAAGLELTSWHEPPDGSFGLSVSRPPR